MSEAIQFLQRMYPGGPWCLSAATPDRDKLDTRSFTDPDVCQAWVDGWNGQRNLYFHVNPATNPKAANKLKRTDVASVNYLHVDVDPPKGEASDAEFRKRTLGLLMNTEPRPTAIVNSGNGFGVFWRLQEPIVLDGSLQAADDAGLYNLEIASKFGGDHCHNVDRLMRLPGTWNIPGEDKIKKGRERRLAELLVFEDDRVYPISTFKKAVASGKQESLLDSSDCGDAIFVSDLAELDAWHVPTRVRIVIARGRIDAEPKKGDNSRSAWVYDVICQLIRFNVPTGKILGILLDKGWDISESVLEKSNPEQYARRQIEKAHRSAKTGEHATSALATRTDGHSDSDVASEDADYSGMSDAYERKFSFFNRHKDTMFGESDTDIGYIAFCCFGEQTCHRLRKSVEWLKWNGSVWKNAEIGDIRSLLRQLALIIENEAKSLSSGFNYNDIIKASMISAWTTRNHAGAMAVEQVVKFITDEIERMFKMVSKLNSQHGATTIAGTMGDYLMVEQSDLDENQDEIVFNNIAYNVADDTWHEPRQQSLATRSMGIDYAEPSLEAQTRWADYIGALGFDEQTLQFLKRSFGFACLGRGGTEKRFWWFRGETNTCKSTLIELVAQSMGTYVETTNANAWLSKGPGKGNGHNDEIAQLRGARLVKADEFPKNASFDDAVMKQCTSGSGMIHASHKGEKGFEFRPRFALFFASNFDPKINEDDAASIARLTALTFKHVIPKDKQDRNYVQNFLSSHDNKLAIIKWLLEGARDFILSGLGDEPAQVGESRDEFIEEQVSVGQQLQTILAWDNDSIVSLTDIMEALAELQKKTRQFCFFNRRQIGGTMKKLFTNAEVFKSSGDIKYRGLRFGSLVTQRQRADNYEAADGQRVF